MSQTLRAVCSAVLLLFVCEFIYGQSMDSTADKLLNFPTKLFGRIHSKTAMLQRQLTTRTERYLQRMSRQEERLKRKLTELDSNAAKNLFARSADRYAALAQQMKNETGTNGAKLSGEYRPYTDSVQSTLNFLQQNPQLLAGAKDINPSTLARFQSASDQFRILQAKLRDASQINTYIQQRKQQIGSYIAQHVNAESLLGKPYAALKQDAYYYSQQVRQYRDMLNDPDRLVKKALSLLNQLPAFQSFVKNNSQLSGLFNLPGNYGSTASLAGLQNREQVTQLIQDKVASAGANGASSLQSSLESAESQLDGFKNKLSRLGDGSGEVDMPDFKPNNQKTRTLWKRLEYGINLQTTHNSIYFPTMTDLGVSLGYNLGRDNIIGLGASYKVGLGNGIRQIALSSQGVGLRSFVDIKLRATLSITGGLEYNYATPFTSFRKLPQLQYWTRSGLIGISKKIPVKNTIVKKTSAQLLWDFLSYYQVPRTQAVLFRIGYSF